MHFSIDSCLRFGWTVFRERPWFYIGATVIIGIALLVVGLVSGVIDYVVTGDPDRQSVIGGLINLLLGTLISMGVSAFFLMASRDPERVDYAALWHPQDYLKFLATQVLVGIVVAIGFLLLVVPGIILSLVLLFATLIVIDRGLGPIEAMKESHRLTSGHKWSLLGFVIVLAILNLIGVLVFGIGFLVSFPVTFLALTRAYRVLSDAAGVVPAVADARL